MKFSTQNPLQPSLRQRSPLALALLGITLGGGHAAQAQATLSLTPVTSTVAVGSTVTFSVNLTGGTNLASYNINVLIDPTQLEFVGSPLFTNTDTAAFPIAFTPLVSASGADLNFAGGNFSSANNIGPTSLGTFQVQVLSALPLAGSPISFGPIGSAGGFDGTQVSDGNNNELTATTGAVLFTPAPEPSQTAAFGLGVFGLGILIVRARKIRQAC